MTFVAPPKAQRETFFKASTGDHSCEVDGNAHTLSCLLTGLTSGQTYAVEAIECLEDDKCSDPVISVTSIPPDGESIFFRIIEYINTTHNAFSF